MCTYVCVSYGLLMDGALLDLTMSQYQELMTTEAEPLSTEASLVAHA